MDRLRQVFGDPTALAVSFRRQADFTPEFLVVSPDFDYEALDILGELCNKSPTINGIIIQAVVHARSPTGDRRKCRRSAGTKDWRGGTTSSLH